MVGVRAPQGRAPDQLQAQVDLWGRQMGLQAPRVTALDQVRVQAGPQAECSLQEAGGG